MPRLSPEELRKARIAKQEEEDATARRRQQEVEDAKKHRSRLEQLISAADALYTEMDKLTRKGPEMKISQLSLERINKIIKSAKELVAEDKDDFMEEITEFIPAGDMPEYRDVTLVLGQVKAGLDRFSQRHKKHWYDLGVD